MIDRLSHEHEVLNVKHPDPEVISRMQYANLDARVKPYVDNISEQIVNLLRKYHFKNHQEFTDHMRDERVSHEDVKRFELLTSRLACALQENKIPKEDQQAWEQQEREKLEQIAVEILGRENVFGPQAVEDTFGTKLEAKDIPPIPFTIAELERAKELGQFLVLRIDKAPDGQPLTMKKMNEIMTPKFQKHDKGKVLLGNAWPTLQSFYTEETPEIRWSLVCKELLPKSTQKDYIEQTQIIVDYLTYEVFKDQLIPEPFKSAIREFESKKRFLIEQVKIDSQNVAKELENLKLTILTRQTAVESSYDTIVRFNTTNTKHLPDSYAWTRTCNADGFFVRVGHGFDEDGLYVYGWHHWRAYDTLGVLFSR